MSRVLVVSSTLLVLTLARTASAQTADAPMTGTRGTAEINTFAAAATYRIPIDVPPFHGIEPKLSLSYNSSGGNRWVGVGWGLLGFSTIERTSASGGTPQWDHSDRFVLDGEPLVACAADTPSPPPASSAGAPRTISAGSP